MDIAKNSSEHGQAMVLIVLGMVVLLGFTALAVDGSMLYSDRRFAQNASDASSLAGAAEAALHLENSQVTYSNWNCGGTKITAAASAARAAAVSRAQDNGVTIDQDISDKNGVEIQCGVDNSNGWADKYMDIHTAVTSDTKSAFSQLIFQGSLRNTVESVARVRPRHNLAFGYAIVALNPDNCQGQQNGATFHGTAWIYVEGSGIFTNGCLRGNGSPSVTVTGGGINYVGQLVGDPSLFNPDPEKVSTGIPASTYEIPEPDCSHPDAHLVSGKKMSGELEPGLYCVSGNLQINGNDSLIGDGVTIFILDGFVHINGNATIQLSAPNESTDPSPAVAGLLFYMAPTNHNVLRINGNSESFYQGSILAAGSDIDILGTAAIDAYQTQIIGWNVQVGGTSDTYVRFDDNLNLMRPTYLELFR